MSIEVTDIPRTHILRRAIVTARVLAIFFMMYVHAWVGEYRVPDQAFTGYFSLVAILFVDVMGRTSVPLLTIISGYLFFTVSMKGKSYPSLLWSKFKTLLVPLWLWNGLFLILLWAYVLLGYGEWPAYLRRQDPWNSILALTDNPATLPLAFLRDIFVCALLSPALIYLLRRFAPVTIVSAFLFAVLDPAQVVILRPQILFFYVIGLAYALRWRVPHAPDFGVLSLLAMIIIAAHVTQQNMNLLSIDDTMENFLSNLSRLSVAWIFWNLCLWLQSRSIYNFLHRIEPFIFLAFCSHFLLFRVLGKILPENPALMPLLFLAQPALAIAFAFAFAWGMGRMAPGALRLLNAGRIPIRRTA